jgi:hypothetical protein
MVKILFLFQIAILGLYEYPILEAQSNGRGKGDWDLHAEHDQQQSCGGRNVAEDLEKGKNKA